MDMRMGKTANINPKFRLSNLSLNKLDRFVMFCLCRFLLIKQKVSSAALDLIFIRR
jgi:hypothetical protein